MHRDDRQLGRDARLGALARACRRDRGGVIVAGATVGPYQGQRYPYALPTGPIFGGPVNCVTVSIDTLPAQAIRTPTAAGLLSRRTSACCEKLYEMTGRKLAVVLETGEPEEGVAERDDEPLSEEDVISLLKETLDAREVADDE